MLAKCLNLNILYKPFTQKIKNKKRIFYKPTITRGLNEARKKAGNK